ncbi:MAG: hypothetical protein NZ992_05005 [Candidatus Korarchaeum sp.]|nr:hypothetical protein [Candidatus Korarchaeum sp.]MDW8036040.1 hypothetical protein [Candidatus Korarchaeum sp.]
MEMRILQGLIILSLLTLPIAQLSCVPIKIDVPIYVPAGFPVSGTVCLTSQIASNLKAKLYVDGSFFQEGVADEMGCYKVTINPLTPGSHLLHAEIFRGGEKVAEIEAKVIAIKGMLLVGPQPLTEIRRGERKEAILTIENKAPLNLSNVALEIEAPFSIFAERMMRVRDFAVYGRIGDLPMNGSKSVKLVLAVPREFRPGNYDLKINMSYEIASSKYSVLLKNNVIVLNETYTAAAETERAVLRFLEVLIAVITILIAAILLYVWRRRVGKA